MTARKSPPRGVPRWLWPPPGATVRRVVIRERHAGGSTTYAVTEGEAPEHLHLRALQWLLLEHPRTPLGAGDAERDVALEIARTEMPGGRVGHAYAIDGGPLGAPSAGLARGVLWRYVHAHVSRVD